MDLHIWVPTLPTRIQNQQLYRYEYKMPTGPISAPCLSTYIRIKRLKWAGHVNKDGEPMHSKEDFRRKFQSKQASRKTTQQVGGQCTQGCTQSSPYKKLEVSHIKETEMEEENWGGHDLNMGQSTNNRGEERRQNYIGYINTIHKRKFTITSCV